MYHIFIFIYELKYMSYIFQELLNKMFFYFNKLAYMRSHSYVITEYLLLVIYLHEKSIYFNNIATQ